MHVNVAKKSQFSFDNLFIIQKMDKKTRTSWSIILGLLILFYLLLVLSPFPNYREAREIPLDEDLFIAFEPPPPPTLTPKPAESQIDKPSDLDLPSEADINDTFNQITFKEMIEEFDPGEEFQQQMEVFDEVGGGLDELVQDIVDVQSGSIFEGVDDFYTGDDQLAVFDIGMSGSGLDSDMGIKAGTGSQFQLTHGNGEGRGGGVGTSIGDGKKVGGGRGVDVPFKSFGEEDYQGKDIINPLIEWMKKHSKDHPYTMRQFLEHETNDLTSIVIFTIQDRLIEIYLRCTEKTKELAICIVENENATKLIDQGISERSHKLEIGTVIRNESDSNIVTIISKNISPTQEKTNAFMSIFLSWWNNGNPLTD